MSLMTGSTGEESGHSTGPGAAGGSLLDAKLSWPTYRQDWLPRSRLLDRMHKACLYPVTLVAAPAGYGKTTLVAQWLDSARPSAAWVSLDAGDNDPVQLWAHISAALQRCGAGLTVETRGTDTTSLSSCPSAIADALASAEQEVMLFLDDFHVITDVACHSQIQSLIETLPPQVHLVLVTRSDPGLRLGRLRAAGGLLEIRAHHLTFTTDEAEALLAQEGVTLASDSLDLLVERTEGWPAGLYLAAFSLTDRADPDTVVRNFDDGNRYIGDYLSEEVLARQPTQIRDFITQISILDRFSADLCDHVTGSTGSEILLRDLARANLFLVPLDGDNGWYRFHHLFATLARSELLLQPREDIHALHSRAAEWFHARGHVDEALEHSIEAGDLVTANLLAHTHWMAYVDSGRLATVRGWLTEIGPPTPATEPTASVTAAWVAALIGDETTLGQRIEALQPFLEHGPLPDGSRSVASAIGMIQGVFGYGGPEEMLRGAELAVAQEIDRHSPFYSVANFTLGHAAYILGDLERALVPLANAQRCDHAPVLIHSIALATESLVEAQRGNVTRARERAEAAVDILLEHGLRPMAHASMAYTALGRALATAGAVEQALETFEQTLAVRRETSANGPWGTVHHLLIYAGVATEIGKSDLAGQLLDELDALLRRFSGGMEAVHARATSLRQTLESDSADVLLGDPLTDREIDILRLLEGSMSLPEIAGELFLSANTVKTHARGVYRKLGVHTRADAVVAARQHGLL